MRWLAAIVVVVVAASLGVVAGRNRDRGPDVGTRDLSSVAVLPFVDLSGGANEYLGDGMAETLINALSHVDGLRVAARTSAFSFKGRQEDVREIGRALGVGAVLEGSVQRAGDRLRITAQLVNTGDGFDLWSETFDRDVSDVFAVQDEVARAVVAALQVELAGGGAGEQVVEEGTANVAAYNAYLQGRFFWDKRTTADMQRAAEFFEEAVALDSSYALAWAGLASTYALFVPAEYNVTTISPSEALDRAEHSARHALRLDDHLGEAHTALALVLEKRGLSEQATAAYERAIEANPRFPTAHQWYSTNLLKLSRDDEALEQMQIAERLDPLSMVILAELAEVLEAVGRRAEARAVYDRAAALYPNALVVNYYFGIHLLMSGEFDRAADRWAKYVIAWTGDSVEARRVAAAIRDPGRREPVLRAIADTARSAIRTAVYRTFGDDEEAIMAFTRAVERPDFEVIYVPHSLALFGPELRADPRVMAAIERFDQRLREKYGR
jgi:serine/threonine-protein kinase